MVVICANEAIVSSDYTSGLERRRLTVPFDVQVPASQRRELISFKDGLHGEFVQYLPGLLNWALALPDAEMVDLLVNTAQSVPSLGAIHADVLMASNPLADWLDARCVFVPGARSQIGDAKRQRVTKSQSSGDSSAWDEYAFAESWLYPNYREYCDRSQVKPISLRRFGRLLVDLCKSQLGNAEVDKDRDRDGAFILGVALRGDSNSDLPCPITGDSLLIEAHELADDAAIDACPVEWRVLPQADRQSAEKLLGLLKQGQGPEDWKPIWFLPGGAEFGDSARAAVIAQLRSADWGQRILTDLGLAV
jgi:putative DNA primase/helicase